MVFCQRNTLFLQNVNILIYLNSSLQTRPPLLLSSSPLQPLFLSSSVPRCTSLPSLTLATCDVCVSARKRRLPRSPRSLSLRFSHAKKSLPSQTLQKPVTAAPCARWRDAESGFGIKRQIEPLQTKADQPLYLACTHAALSFFFFLFPLFCSFWLNTRPPSFFFCFLFSLRIEV